MSRPTTPLTHYSSAHRIIAIGLAWLTAAGGLPTPALSSPPVVSSGMHISSALAAALPSAAALPQEPAPANASAQETPVEKKTREETVKKTKTEADKAAMEAEKWGEITVGQPKIWQYERVNSLLDGLLRDVQGVSLADLTSLDPNATNGAAVKFVQSMLEIGVKYDQGAAVTNGIALQNYRATQGIAAEQLKANSVYLDQLNAQRSVTMAELPAAMQLNSTLQGQLATTTLTGNDLTALTNRQKAAADAVTGLQTQLTTINSQISSASAALTLPPPPNLASTSAGTPPESANTFSSFLGGLPSGVQQNLVNQLQSPTLPATKRLDNFITLLYERLAREISVLQDDLMRDPNNVPFLVQFDVGLYPATRARNHVGVVEFTMDCDGCKVYSIYPGQSSYNLANYEGASKRYSVWGNLLTLIGLGVSADYRRQTDTLHGDLVQSVYISGFQEGAETPDRAPGHENKQQRFGWYYGAAPFEALVTPGIRSTFAIISVPRQLLKTCMQAAIPPTKLAVDRVSAAKSARIAGDSLKAAQRAADRTTEAGMAVLDKAFANAAAADGDVCAIDGITSDDRGDGIDKKLKLHIDTHADWVLRNDPFLKQNDSLPNRALTGLSWMTGISMSLKKDSKFNITKDLGVTLPGTESIFNVPNVVLAERDRLHVLGMEYNPVYYTPPPKPSTDAPATPTPAPPSPETATASASGSGAGTTTVAVSGSGTASASTSGTANTAATATAANPSATQDKSSSKADPQTGCTQDQCAAVLVKLAEPLDPNLVVTVRGQPLRRVRDWRGRGTSILPPAQSASDIAPTAASGAGASSITSSTQPGRENAPSASLLEADLPGPNTWMAVDSHRILLSISKDLAGDQEFPTIQIVDPAKRALFVPLELDTGFSELIMNGFHFPTRDGAQLSDYLSNHLSRGQSQVRQQSSALHPSGPYPYETFLPLFLPRRAAQSIYAYLGETGIQLLIGLEKNPPDRSKTTTPANPKSWLSGKTQVVLEDRYLDLAWSLSCYPQGPMLVCDVPRQEIRDAYNIVKKVCAKQGGCPSISNTLDEIPSISTLQVWVDQYDPEGDDSFYSPVPARLGRFPVEANRGPTDTGPDVGYRPWHFESATQDWVKLTGCYYPNFSKEYPQATRILGRDIPDRFRAQVLQRGSEDGCEWFVIPTLALTYGEVVIEYPPTKPNSDTHVEVSSGSTAIPPLTVKPPDPCVSPATASRTPCTPESLLASQFRPSFGEPRIIPEPKTDGSFAIQSWKVEIPVGRVDCNDSVEVPNAKKRLSAKWTIGAATLDVRSVGDSLQTCPAARPATQQGLPVPNADWQEASKTSQIRLTLDVKKEDLGLFPQKKPLRLFRQADQIEVATLPDLRSLLLPTKLTVVNIGKNQFELAGPGVEAIDAVTLQGPDGVIGPLNAAIGAGVALISLPQSSKSSASSGGGAKTAKIKDLSPPSGKPGTAVTITGENFGSKQGIVTFFNGATAKVACWGDTSIAVTVPPNAQTGKVAVKVPDAPADLQSPFIVDPKDKEPIIAPKCDPPPGTYTVLPLVSLGSGKYLPLDVTDAKGNPLTYAIPDQTKDTNNGNADKTSDGPTTTVTITKKVTNPPAKAPAATGPKNP